MTTELHNSPPKEQCDLVMKGGITSGIVYPPAILGLKGKCRGLKDKYRFRRIGGTSAGAIAAALTAAAEYKREEGGFDRFEEARKKIGSGKFLFNLFRPTRRARPLMDTLLALRGRKRKGIVGLLFGVYSALLRKHPRAFWPGALVGALLGALVGVLLFLLAAWSTSGSLSVWGVVAAALFFAVTFGTLGGPAYGAYDLYRILIGEVVKENFYGMCTGRGDDLNRIDETVLTDWLYARINYLAGKKVTDWPLTFEDLAGEEIPTDEKQERISLRMVTTNLNHGEPYVFPRKENTFLFKEDEMKRLFPRKVVDYMLRYQACKDVKLPDGYHFLPQGNKLPVIVAVRMSMAFPILFSAVPLYTIESKSWVKYKNGSHELVEKDLQRNLFSDGGICSNFPIHFFDAWLPKHPTFGINLLPSLPEDEERPIFSVGDVDEDGDEPGEGEDVRLPKPGGPPPNPEYRKVQNIGELAGAIFTSAQNYRDDMQSRLPSYRERVVQVRLNKNQGGLHLDMSSKTTKEIEVKGERAAEKLLDEFKFDYHLWVRLRVLMNQLETHLNEAKQVLDSKAITALFANKQSEDLPFAFAESRRKEAWKRIKQLSRFIESWQRRGSSLRFYRKRARRRTGGNGKAVFPPVSDAEPYPELRVTPKL